MDRLIQLIQSAHLSIYDYYQGGGPIQLQGSYFHNHVVRRLEQFMLFQ